MLVYTARPIVPGVDIRGIDAAFTNTCHWDHAEEVYRYGLWAVETDTGCDPGLSPYPEMMTIQWIRDRLTGCLYTFVDDPNPSGLGLEVHGLLDPAAVASIFGCALAPWHTW